MKKHDEGYILAYVTVVLLIFCLVATVILTGALRNFQSQQNSIAQMKDQYAAEGMIEQVVAQWTHCTFTEGKPVIIGEVETGVICVENNTENSTVILSATSGTVVITCMLSSAGQYLTFEVGTAATEPTTPEPAMNGGGE